MSLVIVLILVGTLVATLLFMGAYIAKIIVGGKRQTMEESWQWQMEHVPGARAFQRSEFKDYIVKSYDGYELHAAEVLAEEETDRWMIMAHGYTDTRYGMLKYIQFFHRLGFHCVCYDERGHGENRAYPCSYGIREAKDLMEVLSDLYRRKGEGIRVGLLGESLGAATVMTALKYKPKVEFAVDDCGFVEIVPILKAGIKKAGLPSWMVYPASLMGKLRYGVNFTAARPIDSLTENTVPMLIMHGEEDNFIFPSHSERAKETTKGYVELHLIPGAGHAGSAIVAPETYLKILQDFLEKKA